MKSLCKHSRLFFFVIETDSDIWENCDHRFHFSSSYDKDGGESSYFPNFTDSPANLCPVYPTRARKTVPL